MEKGTLGHLKSILNTRFCGSELHKKELVVEFNGERETIVEAYSDNSCDLTLRTDSIVDSAYINDDVFTVGELSTVAFLNGLSDYVNIGIEIDDGYSSVDVKDIRIGDIGTNEIILEVEYQC